MRRDRTAAQVASARRLKLGFVALVGLSGGMIALQANASLLIVAASILSGIAVGAALLWYLLWAAR